MRTADAPASGVDEVLPTSDLTNQPGVAPVARPRLIARALLLLLSLYRSTASLRAPRCRFLPTCSAYAAESIEVHGAARGAWLAVRRIARCHPWNPGGSDPVPPRRWGGPAATPTRK